MLIASAEFLGDFPCLSQLLGVQCVVGVRTEDRSDARVPVLPAIDEAGALGDGVAGTFGIRAALVDHRRAEISARTPQFSMTWAIVSG